MKTIESLINASKKVYVHMSSDEVCRRFFAQAEREGFLFGGEKPTKKEPSDIIAVLPDKTICYVGTVTRPVAPCVRFLWNSRNQTWQITFVQIRAFLAVVCVESKSAPH